MQRFGQLPRALYGVCRRSRRAGRRKLSVLPVNEGAIENPAKKEQYLKSFTLYVDDREVYAKKIADAPEADLQPLAISRLITRISKYDANPANNRQRHRERG